MKKITLVKADFSINFKDEFGSSEFVFIDGGHDHKTLSSDTENPIVRRGVIVWHDFGSNLHNDVSDYSRNQNISCPGLIVFCRCL